MRSDTMRKLITLLLTLFFGIQSAGAQIARLDADDGANAATLAYSVSAGSNRMVVAIISWESDSGNNLSVSGVVYGDQAMVNSDEIATDDGTFNVGTSIWYLLDAGITSATGTTIDATYSGGDPVSGREFIQAASYSGVNQTGGTTTNPSDNETQTGDTTPNPLVTDVTEVSGGLVVASHTCGNDGGNTMTWGAAMTEQNYLDNGAGNQATTSFADRLSTTSLNVDVEAADSNPIRAAQVASVFAPAAAGSAIAPLAAEYYSESP